MLDRCANLQGGHWTILGAETKIMGPACHYEVVDNLIPEMDEDVEADLKEKPNEIRVQARPIPRTNCTMSTSERCILWDLCDAHLLMESDTVTLILMTQFT